MSRDGGAVQRFPCGDHMRSLIRLFAFVLFMASPALAWEHWGGDRGGMRFSPLAQITPENVGNLVRAWEFRTGDLDSRAPEVMKRTKFQSTPLFVEDSLIFCSPFNEVIALDPGSGAQKWRYDPKISTAQRPANRYNCRGVAYWVDDKAPATAACRARIFMNTNDARVIALDARNGIPCADFGANGEVRIETGMPLDWPGEFQITSAPVIVRDTVIIGSAIADNRRVEAPPGTVRAFDARTGRPRWSFDPLLHDGINAGHANVWAPMSVDEERGLVFLPTSSPSPDFWGGKRPGNNDYANSVVALRAETGERAWSYQTVHHDVWDYDLPAQPTLARIDTGAGMRDVVIQPTKPFPTHVPPLLSQEISADDVFGLIPFWERGACRAQVAAARNHGLYTPPSTQGTAVFPMTGGGVNWGSVAFDPVNQILYANVSRAIHIVKLLPRAAVPDGFNPPPGHDFGRQQGAPFAMTRAVALSPLGLPCNKPPWGEMVAVDLKAGKILWRARVGTTEDRAPLGIAFPWGTPLVNGVAITAGGLAFTGAMDAYLRAFDARSGQELWQGRLQVPGVANPMTYLWKGEQYVAIGAGGHSESGTTIGDSVVAFRLPRQGEAPSLWSRTIDQPGGRFLGGAIAVGLVIVLMAVLLWRWRRSRVGRA